MDKAIKIIESEIAQRETANQIKSNLRFEIIKEEIKQLKKVLELVNKTNDIHDVSESSWAYYEKELDKIEQLNQTQSSLHKQMFILRHFANKLGLYDVADYLKR